MEDMRWRTMPDSRCVLLIGLLAGAGCDRQEGDMLSAPITDVAAVGEVELDSSAVAIIGGNREDPGHALHLVQDARLFSKFGVVLAQEGSQSMLYFDSLGTFVKEVGGPGDGPGEFRRIRSVHPLAADTVLAWDAVPARLTVFAPDGRNTTANLRTAADPRGLRAEADHQPLDLHPLSSNLLVAIHPDRDHNPQKHSRQSMFLSIVSRNGEYVASIGSLEGAEWYKGVLLPFGRRFHVAVANGLLYVGDGRLGHLTAFDSAGRPVETLRLPAPRHALTADDQQAEVEELLARVNATARKSVQELLAKAPLPDSTPAFTGLRGSQDGKLWVRLYSSPSSTLDEWLIVDPATRMATTIEIEKSLSVHDATASRVLLMHRDSLGRESLQVFRYGPEPK